MEQIITKLNGPLCMCYLLNYAENYGRCNCYKDHKKSVQRSASTAWVYVLAMLLICSSSCVFLYCAGIPNHPAFQFQSFQRLQRAAPWAWKKCSDGLIDSDLAFTPIQSQNQIEEEEEG